MEQWIVDGRDAIRKRGFSGVPFNKAEDKDFSVDLTGGIRGILKRSVEKLEVAPEYAEYTPAGSPKPKTECLVKVAYFYEDQLADTMGFHKEELKQYFVNEEGFGAMLDALPSWEDNPDVTGLLKVVVGAGEVPQGVEEALMSMEAGDVAEYYLDTAFAFRGDGLPRPTLPGAIGIPPEATVRLLLHLAAFEHEPTNEERIVRGERVKAEANKLFAAGEYTEAILKYHAAFDKLSGKRWRYPGTDEQWRHRDLTLRSSLFANIAACWSKKGHYPAKVLEFCDKALAINPQHVKARFRRAIVREHKIEYDLAVEDLQYLLDSKLVVLSNDEKQDIVAALERIQQKDQNETTGQNDAYRKMFWSSSQQTSTEDTGSEQGDVPKAKET